MAKRQRIDQLVRVNARSGITGDIADVVRAGAARVQADALDAAQHLRSILRFDEAKLKIGARGDLDAARREFLRNPRQFAQLKRFHDAARNAQPAHERLLVRRQVKQSMPFEAENVFLVGRLVRSGMFKEQGIGIERVQFAFDALLSKEGGKVRLHGRGSRIRRDVGEG